MTLESSYNIPAQLVINGKTFDVIVQSITEKFEENPIYHTMEYKDSNGNLFTELYKAGRNLQTITIFNCIRIENETLSR